MYVREGVCVRVECLGMSGHMLYNYILILCLYNVVGFVRKEQILSWVKVSVCARKCVYGVHTDLQKFLGVSVYSAVT